MTRIVEVPASFDDRAFDGFAAGFGAWPPEERILASALAAHLGAPTAPLVAEVRAGRTTWGRILTDAGLVPKDLDGLVRRLVR